MVGDQDVNAQVRGRVVYYIRLRTKASIMGKEPTLN